MKRDKRPDWLPFLASLGSQHSLTVADRGLHQEMSLDGRDFRLGISFFFFSGARLDLRSVIGGEILVEGAKGS